MILSHGNAYELWINHKNGWNAEIFRERYNDVLDRYDFIVGDWGYSQLRLKGFFKDNNTKATKDLTIQALHEYLSEYCNFGCAYFVLERQPDKNGTVRVKSSYEQTEAEWYDLPPKKPQPQPPVQSKPISQKPAQQQQRPNTQKPVQHQQNAQSQQSQQSQQIQGSPAHQKQHPKPFNKPQHQPSMQTNVNHTNANQTNANQTNVHANQSNQESKRPPRFRDRERNRNNRNPRRRDQESTEGEF